jgi:pseudouridine-5'-phosphate glycosidase
VEKVSRRDLAAVVAGGRSGATTVAATALLAARAGIRLFATGGIGGVHRGGADSFDISSDLVELSRTPVAVVCAGAKSILDLPRTLEMLETLGVPVVGYRCDRFPAFYCRDSGLPLELRVDGPDEAARLLDAHGRLGLNGGVVFVRPVAEERALDERETEAWIERALREADRAGIVGKALTPWLLARLTELSDGRTLEANVALLLANADLAARIAVAEATAATGEA